VTEEEMLILNCILYDKSLKETFDKTPKGAAFTLGDWAERFDPSAVRLETADRDSAGMTEAQWEAVRQAVLRNPNLGGLVVADVTHRDTLPDKDGNPTIGNNVTFTNEDMVIVGFVGTTGPGDWYDNGVGGYVWVTDTAQQVAALQYEPVGLFCRWFSM
jgi:hypothetical protein